MKSIQRLILIIPFAGLLVLVGCATPPKTAIQYRPPLAPNPAYTCQTNGVTVTVDPIFEKARANGVFDAEPGRLGIFPVHIRIENNSPNASLLLQKQNFQVIAQNPDSPAQGGTYAPETQGAIGSRGFMSPIPRALMVGFANTAVNLSGGVGMAGNYDYSAAVNRSFVREELRDLTLTSGQSADGCVYFQIPKGQVPSQAVLKISIPNLRGHQTQLFEITILSPNTKN